MPEPAASSSIRPPLRARFSSRQLLKAFRGLFSRSKVQDWIESCPKASFYQRAFIPLILLWYFVFQRLQDNHCLSKILADALTGGADCLSPRGKRLSQQLESEATTSLSDGRQRFPLAVLFAALSHSAQQIRSWIKNARWRDWNIILLDGSTVRLRSLGDLPKAFPPHRSTAKHPYWCLMRVVVGFCLTTGVVVGTAMAGVTTSEQALACQLLPQLLPQSLLVGDRNFGIFSVIQAARAANAQLLVRLTKVRALKLARTNNVHCLGTSMDLLVQWAPTRHDKVDPTLCLQPCAGRLLVMRVRRPGFRSQVLYLFTTLCDQSTYTAAELLELYGARWQVELNLRFVKAQMKLGFLRCKSAQMARKEWVAGLLAYNVIRSLMVAAASQAQVPITVLSFSRTREFLQSWIQRHNWHRLNDLALWQRLLLLIAKCRQPHRKKPRPPEPRAIRYFNQDFPALKGDRALARKKLTLKS